ncbi:MAG TPA: hypothetical protein VNW29_08025 [Candidatus Sulfotelmatobacter sp.]|nr:hypothetical protein [Candidatus Sulfotelmatobacter sp.]
MYKKHPQFDTTRDDLQKIWRYMDFTKLVSLLDKKELYFSRADKLNDSFEGSFPKGTVELRPFMYADLPKNVQETILKMWQPTYKNMLKATFINSWHINDYESAAMWKLYLQSNEGIAIQSDVGSLKKSFDGKDPRVITIGDVKYIDYEKDFFPDNNTLYPYFHKRKSFEHEMELRAVTISFPLKGDGVDFSVDLPDIGLYIPVDLNILIKKIYVSPDSPKWFFKLVKAIKDKYGLKQDVLQSDLIKSPLF